jgi:hypothetical protein
MNARRPRDGIKKEKWQEKKEVNISSLFCLMKAIYVSLMNLTLRLILIEAAQIG